MIRNLALASKDSDVRAVQDALNDRRRGGDAWLNPDGDFGKLHSARRRAIDDR